MATSLLTAMHKQLVYYRGLGRRTFEQLTDEQLFYKPDPASNSVAMIVKHMAGNMRSRFTDFLTSDGEKPWRNRETEFDDDIKTRADLLRTWQEGWDLVLDTVDKLEADQIDDLVYIRNIGHSVGEALLRQVAHYAYHTGQIVYLGVMQRGEDWQSLSIPKGKSADFNRTAFAQDPKRGHFTDQFIDASQEKTQ